MDEGMEKKTEWEIEERYAKKQHEIAEKLKGGKSGKWHTEQNAKHDERIKRHKKELGEKKRGGPNARNFANQSA